MGIYELDNSLSEMALYWLVEKKTCQNHFSCPFFLASLFSFFSCVSRAVYMETNVPNVLSAGPGSEVIPLPAASPGLH